MAGKIGRPSGFTQKLADEICFRLANGESTRQICRDEHMPSLSGLFVWLANPVHKKFVEQYAQARETWLEHLAQETLDIAEDGSNDWTERETARGRLIRSVDRECVQRSALRIDTRKWLLSKLRPDKYGERTMLGDSKGGNELVVTVRSVLDPPPGDTSNKEKK